MTILPIAVEGPNAYKDAFDQAHKAAAEYLAQHKIEGAHEIVLTSAKRYVMPANWPKPDPIDTDSIFWFFELRSL